MNKGYRPSIDNLLAIINILDEYETFIKNLEKFLIEAKINDQNMLINIELLSKIDISGGNAFGNKKYKKKYRIFYKENKQVIDKICEHSRLMSFVSENYNCYGKKRDRYYSDYFYQYFKTNHDKLPQIISLLKKLKKLNFNRIYFNEDFDFAAIIYEIRNDWGTKNELISYLDNIEIVLNYDDNFVKYKTTHSDYRIICPCFSSAYIELKSLLLDPNRLPEKVSKEYLYNKINELKSKKTQEYSDVRASVDLNTNTIYMNKQIENINNTLSRINDYKTKQELIELLEDLKQSSEKLQNINSQYSDLVVQSTGITSEQLEEEKQKLLKR